MENFANCVLLQGCTVKDIEAMIDRCIRNRMKEFAESLKEKPPVMVKRKDAARRLGISLPTIDKYAQHGILHPKHIGGRVYYEEDELKKIRTK